MPDPLIPEAAAADVEVIVDADGTIHASMTMPLDDEQEADPEEAAKETPAATDEIPSVGDVVGTVIKAAGKTAAKTAGALWDVIKPDESTEPSEP